MADEIEIRRLQKSEIPNLLEFLRKEYGEERKTDFPAWKWQFLENPALQHDEIPIWVLHREGRIAGQIACIAANLKIGDETRQTVWILNFVVDSSLRGQGWGQKLVRAVGEQFPTMLTLGINEQSERVFSKLGWSSLGRIHRYYKLLYPGHSPKKNLSGPLRALLNAAAMPLRLPVRSAPAKHAYEIRSMDSFPGEFDHLWTSAARQWPCCIERSSGWLKWQFSAQPGKKFSVLGAYNSGRLTGYVVLYLRYARGSAFPYKIAISDVCYAPEDAKVTVDVLLGETLRLAKERRAGGVVIDVLDSVVEESLKALRFFRIKEAPKFMAVSKDHQQLLLKAESWRLTRADSDISIIEEPNL